MIAASASRVRAVGATARPIAAGRTRRPVALASAPPASAPTRSAMTTTRTAARETPAVVAGAGAGGVGAVWAGGGVLETGISGDMRKGCSGRTDGAWNRGTGDAGGRGGCRRRGDRRCLVRRGRVGDGHLGGHAKRVLRETDRCVKRR